MNRRFLLYTFLCCMFAAMVVSCKDDDEIVDGNGTVALSSNVAITAFNLVDNKDILANLDSVFFTIDLKKAEIYNADSLPKGTDISRMLVEMSYPTCYSVEVSINGAERMADTTFAYTSSDTIDFTGRVTVKLTAADQVTTRTYNIKVNVHEMESDSLQWNRLERRDLPSLYNNVTQQKTVKFDDDVYCLMRDNGTYVLGAADAPDASWSSEAVEFQFTPDIVSFTATDDAFYIISADNGELYTSHDARNWSSCGVYWASVVGVYGNRVLGVTTVDGSARYMLDEYPRRANFVPIEAEEGFPVRGASNMVMYRSEWGTNDIGIIIGGVTASGERIGRSWGYDGENWSLLGNNDIGPHEGMMLLNYTTFDVNTDNWTATPRPTLLALGGYVKDGEADNTLYVSRNYGVSWTVGDSLIQLPDYIPDVAYADAIVFNTTMTDKVAARSGNTVWESHPSRELPVWYMAVDLMSLTSGDGVKPVESWEVPYIYLFGGYTRNGNVSNSIWKGVINRLMFKPIY